MGGDGGAVRAERRVLWSGSFEGGRGFLRFLDVLVGFGLVSLLVEVASLVPCFG